METKWANQRKRSRNSYPSVSGAGLENQDKARLCILAREAWDVNDECRITNVDFATWRKHQQFLAVTGANPLLDRTSRLSLRDCTKRDLLKLVAHFENLAGETGRAVKTHMRAATQDTAVAMHNLTAACGERGLSLSYPAKICAKQNKCALEDASANQLWRLVFTVRNRRKKRDASPVLKTASPASDPF